MFAPKINTKQIKDIQAKAAAQKTEQAKALEVAKKGWGDTYINKDGMQAVDGGTNIYGFKRPDTILMRDKNNQIHDAFKESMGESTQKLRDYGNTFGSDVDARAKMGMGSAYEKMQSQAMGTGDLESTALMREQLNQKTLADAGRFNKQNANNLSSMQTQMAMRGGMSGGSAERMAKSSMRDQMMGQQNIAAQNRDQNLSLSIDNANRRDALLKDVGQVQQSNNQYNANAFTNNQNRQLDALSKAGQVEQNINQSNINAARGDLDKQNLANQNLYGEDMSAWAAQQTASAQKAAAPKSGGCCFIFLEARYGTGAMDKVVRRFRDEHMTDKNKRGYYKLSEVLVPLMRKYKPIKLATRLLMTDPMVAYGKAYYGEGTKLGYIFKPLTHFWLGVFDFLGGEHEFIRENGEVI